MEKEKLFSKKNNMMRLSFAAALLLVNLVDSIASEPRVVHAPEPEIVRVINERPTFEDREEEDLPVTQLINTDRD